MAQNSPKEELQGKEGFEPTKGEVSESCSKEDTQNPVSSQGSKHKQGPTGFGSQLATSSFWKVEWLTSIVVAMFSMADLPALTRFDRLRVDAGFTVEMFLQMPHGHAAV